MKKRILVLLTAAVFMTFATGAFAAKKADTTASTETGSIKVYDSGMMAAQLGIGFGVPGTVGDMTFPPLVASFEYDYRFAPKVPLSFGVTIGYSAYEYKYDLSSYEWKYDYSYLLIGARCSYHFIDLFNLPNADIYAGVLLGFTVVSFNVTVPSGLPSSISSAYTESPSFFDFGVYAGIRYYFTPMIGVYAEVGYSFGYINAGVVFKF